MGAACGAKVLILLGGSDSRGSRLVQEEDDGTRFIKSYYSRRFITGKIVVTECFSLRRVPEHGISAKTM